MVPITPPMARWLSLSVTTSLMEDAGTSAFFLPEVNSRVPFWTVSVPVALCFTPSSPRTCLVSGKVPGCCGCCAMHGVTRNIPTVATAPNKSPLEVIRTDTSRARIPLDCACLALYDPELHLRLVHGTLLPPRTQPIRLRKLEGRTSRLSLRNFASWPARAQGSEKTSSASPGRPRAPNTY